MSSGGTGGEELQTAVPSVQQSSATAMQTPAGATPAVAAPESNNAVPQVPQQFKFPASDVKHFVGGFGAEVTEQMLRDHFSEFGQVIEVRIMRDQATGKNRGFGFVTMAEPSSKQKIYAMKEHRIGDRKTSVRPYADPHSTDLSGGCGIDGPVLQRKIFVGGINPALGQEVLECYFGKYGPLEDVAIMKYPDGRSRGFGFVVFRDEASCSQVLQQRVHTITADDKVEVKPCLARGKARTLNSGPYGIGGPGSRYNGTSHYQAAHHAHVHPLHHQPMPLVGTAGGLPPRGVYGDAYGSPAPYGTGYHVPGHTSFAAAAPAPGYYGGGYAGSGSYAPGHHPSSAAGPVYGYSLPPENWGDYRSSAGGAPGAPGDWTAANAGAAAAGSAYDAYGVAANAAHATGYYGYVGNAGPGTTGGVPGAVASGRPTGVPGAGTGAVPGSGGVSAPGVTGTYNYDVRGASGVNSAVATAGATGAYSVRHHHTQSGAVTSAGPTTAARGRLSTGAAAAAGGALGAGSDMMLAGEREGGYGGIPPGRRAGPYALGGANGRRPGPY